MPRLTSRSLAMACQLFSQRLKRLRRNVSIGVGMCVSISLGILILNKRQDIRIPADPINVEVTLPFNVYTPIRRSLLRLRSRRSNTFAMNLQVSGYPANYPSTQLSIHFYEDHGSGPIRNPTINNYS